MGPIPQTASSQYKPPQLDTNPNVSKHKAAEKSKRAVHIKRFRPNTASKPSEVAGCPHVTISKAPISNPKHKKILQKIDLYP